jgi:chromosome partitioning protein
MPVLAVVNRKGGVGKSTLCVNLAAGLAERGERVLVCDLDPQAAATSHLGVDYTAQDSLADVLQGDRSLDAVIVPTAHGVDLVPSSPFLINAETQLLQVPGREKLLSEQLAAMQTPYAWVLLDTPPSLGVLTLNALAAADLVLIVAIPEFASVEAVGHTMESIAVVRRRLNDRLRLLGVVANRTEPRVKSVQEVCRRFEALGALVLASRVRKTVRLADAFGFQEPILTFDPRHPVCDDIRGLTEEVARLASP